MNQIIRKYKKTCYITYKIITKHVIKHRKDKKKALDQHYKLKQNINLKLRIMENLKNIERTRALQTAPSVEFAKMVINEFVENNNLRTDGYFRTSTDECACGETQCLVYEIEREGILSVSICEICGADDAITESYININC